MGQWESGKFEVCGTESSGGHKGKESIGEMISWVGLLSSKAGT